MHTQRIIAISKSQKKDHRRCFQFTRVVSMRPMLEPYTTSNLSKAHETRDSLSSSYSQVVLI